MIPFGDIVRNLRCEQGWSQSLLASRLGISESQVANYELSRRFPSLQVLIKTAKVFHVSTDFLLGIDTTKKHCLDISDLLPDEIASLNAVVNCYRNLHKG